MHYKLTLPEGAVLILDDRGEWLSPSPDTVRLAKTFSQDLWPKTHLPEPWLSIAETVAERLKARLDIIDRPAPSAGDEETDEAGRQLIH